MDSERLKQVEEIYHAVLEIAPDERESFFKENCRADEELRREVESLLSFENTFDSFLDAPPESLAAEMFAAQDEQTELIGKEIGHYKIIKILGKGGMGEVYLDEIIKPNRKVVSKLLYEAIGDNKNRN
jgi:serine/threonine-protein kinase